MVTMDLSNYSAKDCVSEWLLDRARAPHLLKRAVEDAGVEGVIAIALEMGAPRGAIVFALQKAGCISTKSKPEPEDPFRDKLEKLWRRDRARFMEIVERLWSTNGL